MQETIYRLPKFAPLVMQLISYYIANCAQLNIVGNICQYLEWLESNRFAILNIYDNSVRTTEKTILRMFKLCLSIPYRQEGRMTVSFKEENK